MNSFTKLMGIFTLMFILLAVPIQAKITEKETVCGIFECYSIFTIDKNMNIYEDKKYSVMNNRFPLGEIKQHFGNITDMKIEILKGNLIKVSGNIGGATSNLWGFSILSDYSHINSTWWNSSYGNCKNITITNAGTTDLINFPAFLNVSYDNNMSVDFIDLRFINESCLNNGSLLSYEIDNFTASTRALVWVNIPNLSATGKTISMYYNNLGATNGQDVEGTWNNDYMTVLHLTDDTTSTTNDSTKYGIDWTKSSANNPIEIAGKISKGQNFTSDYLTHATFMDAFPDNGIIELWITPASDIASTDAVNFYFISKYQTGASTYNQIGGLFGDGVNTITIDLTYGSNDRVQVPATVRTWYAGTWYHVVLGWGANGQAIYINGVLEGIDEGRTSIPSDGTASDFGIGGSIFNGGYFFNGLYDEFRVSNISRSIDWINQTFLMINDTTAYVTFGTEQTEPPPPSDLNISFINPTPDTNTTVGFDAPVIINMSFLADGVITDIFIEWNGVNHSLANLGGYSEYYPSVLSGVVYSYRGYLNATDMYNNTELRTLIVSTFTQEEIDNRFELSDMILLLFLFLVGIITFILIKI